MWMMVCWQIWWWKVWKCSRSVVSDSLWSYRLHIAAKLLSPWDFPGKNTGMDCHFLLQGIFRTQGSSGTEGRLFTIWAMREWKCWSLSSVQLLSRVRLFATPWIAAHQASLSITNSQSSLRVTPTESVMPSRHLIPSSPSPPAPNPSQHQSLFQWANSSHEVAKVLEFQLQHHSFQRNPRTDLL